MVHTTSCLHNNSPRPVANVTASNWNYFVSLRLRVYGLGFRGRDLVLVSTVEAAGQSLKFTFESVSKADLLVSERRSHMFRVQYPAGQVHRAM